MKKKSKNAKKKEKRNIMTDDYQRRIEIVRTIQTQQ